MKFCCKQMQDEVQELKNTELKDHTVVYDQRWRIFLVYFCKDAAKRDRVVSTHIYHCPWCGKNLPSNLSDKWFDTLKEEYSITDPSHTEYDKVPDEFRTDAWWKKRKL